MPWIIADFEQLFIFMRYFDIKRLTCIPWHLNVKKIFLTLTEFKIRPGLTCGFRLCPSSFRMNVLLQLDKIEVFAFEMWLAVSLISKPLWWCQYLQLTLILNYFQALLVLESYKEVKLLGQGKNTPYCIKPFNFSHSPWHQVECSDLKDPYSLHHLQYISMSGGWRDFSCQ